ncbi:MAG TPA: TIGR04282 family arsenosugar biosynthesis glycosyltransferase [Roseiarcus sp.]|nr:TIGR04282 family arsenosugar biosynthesis glycosyltransferase [Roseiarcus sp.]
MTVRAGRPSAAAIGVICKAPRVGLAKTRLIPRLGAERAAEISACFLRDIAASIASLPAAVDARGYAIFAPSDAEEEMRAIMPPQFGLVCHADGNLGRVLFGATRDLLSSGHSCVLLVNSDSPTLPPARLREAIEHLSLSGDRLVLGPATDGGYYLIGLKTAHPRVFEDVRWGSDVVLAETLGRATEIGLPVVQLASWYDVDDAESFAILKAELRAQSPEFAGGGDARATRAFLASIGEIEPTASISG